MKCRAGLSEQRTGAVTGRHAACLAGLWLAMLIVMDGFLLAPRALAGGPEDFVGSPAGDFTLQDVEGRQVSLSDFRGRTVLLSFWATWCLPCQKELPTLQKLYEQHQDRDVVVLTVDDESNATIKTFLKAHHYGFTALMDPKRTLFRKFVVRYIPTVIVINDEGIIVREIVGWEGPQKLLAAIETGELVELRGRRGRETQGQAVLANCKAEPGDDR